MKRAITRAYNELIVQLLEVAFNLKVSDRKQNQTQNTICIGWVFD